MEDLAFILGLMKEESHNLGFIPSTAIRDRFLAPGNVLWIPDDSGARRGYLLFATPGRRPWLSINQTAVDYDHRRRHHAALAVQKLIEMAIAHDCQGIRLHCGLDMQATEFWKYLGFSLVETLHGGKTTRRIIGEFHLRLDTPYRPGIVTARTAFRQVQNIDLAKKGALDARLGASVLALWSPKAKNAPFPADQARPSPRAARTCR